MTSRALPVAGSEQRTYASLLLESIALRHQLERMSALGLTPKLVIAD